MYVSFAFTTKTNTSFFAQTSVQNADHCYLAVLHEHMAKHSYNAVCALLHDVAVFLCSTRSCAETMEAI